MSDTEYVFRWYCGACSEASDWYPSAAKAAASRTEHEDSHAARYDGPVVEHARLQRYPKADAPGFEAGG